MSKGSLYSILKLATIAQIITKAITNDNQTSAPNISNITGSNLIPSEFPSPIIENCGLLLNLTTNEYNIIHDYKEDLLTVFNNYNQGNHGNAFDVVDAIIATSKTHNLTNHIGSNHAIRGCIYQAQGNYEDAEKDYTIAGSTLRREEMDIERREIVMTIIKSQLERLVSLAEKAYNNGHYQEALKEAYALISIYENLYQGFYGNGKKQIADIYLFRGRTKIALHIDNYIEDFHKAANLYKKIKYSDDQLKQIFSFLKNSPLTTNLYEEFLYNHSDEKLKKDKEATTLNNKITLNNTNPYFTIGLTIATAITIAALLNKPAQSCLFHLISKKTSSDPHSISFIKEIIFPTILTMFAIDNDTRHIEKILGDEDKIELLKNSSFINSLRESVQKKSNIAKKFESLVFADILNQDYCINYLKSVDSDMLADEQEMWLGIIGGLHYCVAYFNQCENIFRGETQLLSLLNQKQKMGILKDKFGEYFIEVIDQVINPVPLNSVQIVSGDRKEVLVFGDGNVGNYK